ncbi:MAG TPA: PQQ-binding-like beta-propeller repeat protein [Cytophagales bacterium]|nr:PQQ-binding-like beta-propeller repeat protein [Cytophagales bacterium]
MRKLLYFLLLIFCLSCTKKDNNKDWPIYGGDSKANRYSSLDQINTDNVKQLEVAWEFHTEDNPVDSAAEIQCHPIVVNGTLFGTTSKLKAFALDAATGKRKWIFDPFKNSEPQIHASRGVTYWEEGEDKRILYTAGSNLYCLDASTGNLIKSFGNEGIISLLEGLDKDVSGLYVINTTPGIVYKDLLILGSRVSENSDAAPGHVRAFDIKTGKRKWIFHTIPGPGEYGHETWPKDAYKKIGGVNVWSGFSLDEERGMVFLPTGSPSYDFYGKNRLGENLFGNCIVALNAETGKRMWHFQTVHHDLWDRDLPCQPSLVTVEHNGKKIDAVAQATKSGFVFLLDRETGKPLWPVEEKPFPESDLPGEVAWPTQPVPSVPEPFARQEFKEGDLNNLVPDSYPEFLEKFKKSKTGSIFIPPSKQGTLIFPGFDGGAEWGGNAFDPASNVLYLNSNEMPWILTMVDVGGSGNEVSKIQKTYTLNCAPCHGIDRMGDQHAFPSLVKIGEKYSKEDVRRIINSGKGRMPSFKQIPEEEKKRLIDYLFEVETTIASRPKEMKEGTEDKAFPYVHTGYHRFVDKNGYPAIKPPWGTLNALDLNTGKYLWRVPLGEFPELSKKGIPPTGTENYGGPIVTAGGLVFIGATKDEMFRAIDKNTGKVLWQTKLPAGGYATPTTYAVNGKQYVVIAAGGTKMGTKPGDSYIAFSLPD